MTTIYEKIELEMEKTLAKINQAIEMAAAKIIKEINDKIDKCECTKNLLEDLNSSKQITFPLREESQDIPEKSLIGLTKYSYPNYMVGNEELGSSEDPRSLTWSIDTSK